MNRLLMNDGKHEIENLHYFQNVYSIYQSCINSYCLITLTFQTIMDLKSDWKIFLKDYENKNITSSH